MYKFTSVRYTHIYIYMCISFFSARVPYDFCSSQSQTHHLFTNSINCRIHQQRFKCLFLQLGGGALHYVIACEFLIFIGALFAYIYIYI